MPPRWFIEDAGHIQCLMYLVETNSRLFSVIIIFEIVQIAFWYAFSERLSVSSR